MPPRSLRHALRRSVAACCLAAAAAMAIACAGDPARPTSSDGTAVADSIDRAIASPGDTLFASVVTGAYHACGLTRGGRAFCWGLDDNGQLGIARTLTGCAEVPGHTCSRTPVAVDLERRYVALTTGYDRTCGLTVSGRVWCWGGYALPRGPWPVRSTAVYTRLAAIPMYGDPRMCAIATTGRTDCWVAKAAPGTAQFAVDAQAAPLAGSDALRFTSLGADCGVTTRTEFRCWDVVDTAVFAVAGVAHELCQGGGTPGRPIYLYACHYPPVPLVVAGAWARAVRDYRNCAISTDARFACWSEDATYWSPATFVGGRQPVRGGPAVFVTVPEPVQNVVMISSVVCAHAVAGRVYCWGGAGVGEFGTGVARETFDVPSVAAQGRAFVSFDGAALHACGVTADGAAYCWGRSDYGQVGADQPSPDCSMQTFPCFATPTPVASLAGR